jgi:anti-sigma factor RsiW
VTDLDKQWAKSQVEALVDGSLPPESERRMQAALRQEHRLRREVDAARALRRELKRLRKPPMPHGLVFRLLSIPVAERPSQRRLLPVTGVAALAVIAIGAGVFPFVQESSEARARVAAVEDFQLAMVYLQKSTALAHNQVSEAVSLGILGAVETSRHVLYDERRAVNNGGEQDED